MGTVRLVFAGGFLGSGKTTLLYRAARILAGRGYSVGIVTNDQAAGSFDTRLQSHRGLAVREVGGSCFCCDFRSLVRNASALRRERSAEVILLEPVGSCTDLSATVLQPLKDRIRGDLLPSPLSVLADPFRLRNLLRGKRSAARRGPDYIFRKQLEEADLILIGKADLLDRESRRALRRRVVRAFPGIPVRTVSPLTGAGVSAWLNAVLSSPRSGNRVADVDYDVYAAGEAALGWLNADLTLAARGCCIPDWRKLSLFLMREMKESFRRRRAAVGHVKILLSADGNHCTANLTRLGGPIDVRGDLAGGSPRVRMTVNARVETDPGVLERILLGSLETVIRGRLRVKVHALRSFRPARPRPTYRYDGPVADPVPPPRPRREAMTGSAGDASPETSDAPRES